MTILLIKYQHASCILLITFAVLQCISDFFQPCAALCRSSCAPVKLVVKGGCGSSGCERWEVIVAAVTMEWCEPNHYQL